MFGSSTHVPTVTEDTKVEAEKNDKNNESNPAKSLLSDKVMRSDCALDVFGHFG